MREVVKHIKTFGIIDSILSFFDQLRWSKFCTSSSGYGIRNLWIRSSSVTVSEQVENFEEKVL